MSDKIESPRSQSDQPNDSLDQPGDAASAGASSARQQRKGPRSRREVERERHQFQTGTDREIDQIVAEFHRLLPREQAQGIGGIYARYSSRFQHSIADQVRSLYEAALRQGIFIPREHVCFDLAVRGYKEDRPGLNRLRQLFQSKALQVLLVFTTNRLYRKTYKALQFVEEEVVERGIRCLFLKSGVDSADEKRWRMLLQIHAMTDEFVVGMYADNVRAAHEGLFERRLVCGTLAFGYQGQPIPGELTRRQRPRCRVVIDPEASRWVVQIFTWYVQDRISLAGIVRRLNENPGIPLPPRATSEAWTHQAVHGLLANPRYRGYWEYARTEVIWQSKKDYARQVLRQQPLRAEQFEELRIIPDVLWYAAQKRLSEEDRSAAGRKPRDGDRRSRPRLLNGLFRCPEHDQILYVGGVHGRYMFCKVCKGLPPEQRPLYSQLPRELALRLTCQKLAELVRGDEHLLAQVMACCRQAAEQAQQPDLSGEEELRKREGQLSRQIQFLLRNAGETEADQRESAESLKALRRARAEVAADLARLEAAPGQPLAIPQEADIRALLSKLGDVLAAAAEGDEGADSGAAREVIELLTGGRIALCQQGERKAQRGWLLGRLRVRLLSYLLERATGHKVVGSEEPGVEVTIDYREPSPLEEQAERAKALYDLGLMNCQIAAELGCARNWVTKLLKHWFGSRGLPVPDGRARRSTLARKQVGPTLSQELAEAAKALWDEGWADVQIAARLGCSPPTAEAAVAYWHTACGLPAPMHTERREALVDRMQGLYEQGWMIREIAQETGMCSRSVTLLLRQRFASLGRPMPDGRTRRALREQDRQETKGSS